MANPRNYEELIAFLRSKSGLRMSHIYKPAMLLVVLRSGGTATKEEIAREFVLRNDGQVEFYRRKIVHPMPGQRLVRDGLLSKDNDTYHLTGVLASLTSEQMAEVEEILESRIADYMEMRNPFGDSNLDAVPGSLRYEVLKEAGGRCENCGVSSRETQIDVDHIVPRAKTGSNDRGNLQALCQRCNTQKRERDDTRFSAVHDSYGARKADCIFCRPGKRVISESDLAYVIEDAFPVTEGHSLVIPKRHVADYFDLFPGERNQIEHSLRETKTRLIKKDATITGFNVGINIGESAGQSVFHVHVHLIPRRKGDVDNPRGGVRNAIPGKGDY